MKKVGIIVGNGKLPLYFLEEANEKYIDIYPVGLFDSINLKIKEHKNYIQFNIGQVGEIIKYFMKNNISEVVMLGKVEKEIIFKNMKLDKIGEGLLKKLPDTKDETLLFGVILLLKINGVKVLPQNYLLKDMMFEKKCYTKRSPDEVDISTIEIGKKTAKLLSTVDVGQSVICKNRSVIALEGIEGTDATILRGGTLSGEGTILIKMARPHQDMRVDIPAIGLNTIKKLLEIKAKGVVGEAGRMLFLEKKESIKLADENNFFIIGK
ncbi:MAG: LpxI family protein [Fusobacteriaceae bacterium]